MLLWWNPTAWIGLLGVVIIGFFIAPIFPGLVSGTSGRVGPRYAANTIGMQIGAAGLRIGDSSGYRRCFGPTDFPGNDSGVPDHFGGDTIRVVFIVYTAGENTFDLKLR